MIDTKELRLGNYVTTNEQSVFNAVGNEPYKVIGIEPHQCEVNVGGYGEVILGDRLLHPYALTEEWLKLFGFEILPQTDDCYYIKSNDIEISFVLNRDEMFFDNKGCQMQFKHTHIKYVHQLQNLYFALTGNELTLTPAKEEMK